MPAIKEKVSRPKSPAPTPLVPKFSFGAITKKKADRTTYPVLPDPNGQLAIIAARIIQRVAQIDALEGVLSIDKSDLKTLATPFYFAQAQGKVEAASTAPFTARFTPPRPTLPSMVAAPANQLTTSPARRLPKRQR